MGMSRGEQVQTELFQRFQHMIGTTPPDSQAYLSKLRYTANHTPGIYNFDDTRADKKIRFAPALHKFFGTVGIAGALTYGVWHAPNSPLTQFQAKEGLPIVAIGLAVGGAYVSRTGQVNAARQKIYDWNNSAPIRGLHSRVQGTMDAASVLLESAGAATITLAARGTHITEGMSPTTQSVVGAAGVLVGATHHVLEKRLNNRHMDNAVLNMTNTLQNYPKKPDSPIR